jgi:hypothetical protein
VTEVGLPTFVRFVLAVAAAVLGVYVVAGLVYAALTTGWPPFWPPMQLAVAPIEAVTTPASVVVLALLYGGVVAVLGPTLFVVGSIKAFKYWKHRARFFD